MSPTDKALVVMERGPRRSQLSAEIAAHGLTPIEADNCRQARQAIGKQRSVKLMISGTIFLDGDWRDMLAIAERLPEPASFLVSAPFPDHHLWSEALWRGAYDLLVEPYSAPELRRIIDGALRAQKLAATPLPALPQAV